MRYLVTGAAGFIGSSLANRLISEGNEVIGVDSIHKYYSKEIKFNNLKPLMDKDNFSFYEMDICDLESSSFKSNFDCIFHIAGQPGVRDSWGSGFDSYAHNNVLGTQRVFNYAALRNVRNIIYSSSSSVYGNAEAFPTLEDSWPQPTSPYGVSKLTGEFLADSYTKNFELGVLSLRYFTVYGPKQRPDMATNRLIKSAFTGDTFEKFGSGEQMRDFTYVDDIVNANILASARTTVGTHTTFNIGGGSGVSLNELINLVEEISNKKINIAIKDVSLGDAARTGADISRAKQMLNWEPKFALKDGLANQIEWQSDTLQIS
jgi:UDP-glucuronate 4-epimerase